jgi:sec-independent protein translocase protein TatA
MGVGVLQPWHIILVLVIVLVVFGPGKLPMLGKAVGDTVRDFKKAVTDEHEPSKSATTVTELPTAATRPCPTCQKPVTVGDRFCGACGSRTEVAAV